MFANLRNIEKIKLLVIGLFMVLILGSYAQFVMQVGFSNPGLVWEEFVSAVLGSALLGIFVIIRNKRGHR
ncbi:hypothetical protein [Anaerospora sp.]|jgi:uncharacterized membrane protein YvlD (DUF360 family)|uniref:hypothetical protein n=1 Tax=Anaerospora sp. TaxID=1960278 RepID=UPI00289EEB21|nr:hypothetical protein [Anaerospora sp.]